MKMSAEKVTSHSSFPFSNVVIVMNSHSPVHKHTGSLMVVELYTKQGVGLGEGDCGSMCCSRRRCHVGTALPAESYLTSYT